MSIKYYQIIQKLTLTKINKCFRNIFYCWFMLTNVANVNIWNLPNRNFPEEKSKHDATFQKRFIGENLSVLNSI